MKKSKRFDKEKIKGVRRIKLFFLPFILIGFFALYFSIKNVLESTNCSNWEKTMAYVDEVGFLVDNEDGVTTYNVKLHYHYFKNNMYYNGNRIAFGYNFNNTDNHRELYDVLKGAKKIVVFTNPENPADAVVVPGMNNSIKGNLIFAGLWNSFLLLFYVFIFSENSRKVLIGTFLGLLIIWIAGFVLLSKKEFNIHIENKIEVIEKKGQ